MTLAVAAALLAIGATTGSALARVVVRSDEAVAPTPPSERRSGDRLRIPPVAMAPEPGPGPVEAGFEETAMVPANVSLFLHVEHASEMRHAAVQRPVGAFLLDMARSASLGDAWTQLARDLSLPPGAMFDRYFGRSATIACRPLANDAVNGDAPSLDWVLLTVVEEADVALLVRRLAPRIHGGGWYGLARQKVDFAWHAPVLVIAPSRHAPLATEVSALLGGGGGGRLAESDEAGAARRLGLVAPEGAPRIELIARHEAPMGGASVLSAALVGERLVMRHAGRFEHAPFRFEPMGATMDISILGRFVDTAVVATVQPTDPTGLRRDPMLSAVLPMPDTSDEARRNLGERRVMVVGEGEGRRAPRPFDMAYPTLAVAVEVRDAELAARQQDRLVAACVASLSARFLPEGRLPAAVPNLDTVPTTVRSVELTAIAKELIGDHPLADTIGLHWKTVTAHGSSWQIFASDRSLLEEVSGDLRSGGPTAPQRGAWEMAGFANGPRIAAHLTSWAPHASLFVAPEESGTFRSTLDTLAGLAAGFSAVTWRMARPDERSVILDVELELAPPETGFERLTPRFKMR